MEIKGSEMKKIDQKAIEDWGIPGIVLMERAALGACGEIVKRGFENIHIFVGSGNNGGDGYALARLLTQEREKVSLYPLKPPATDDALLNESLARKMGIAFLEPTPERIAGISSRDLIVDALFGTGLCRPLEGRAKTLVEALNRSSARRLALDVPSGLDTERGECPGVLFQADETVSFHRAKRGLSRHGGKVTVVSIGIYETKE